MNSIGLVEVSSIAIGYLAGDAMVKTASVKLIECIPLCPGKFIILVGGEVADVISAVQAGKEIADDCMIDSLVIPNVNPQVFKAINGTTSIESIDALGIFETFTIASGIIAADAAVKAASVDLLELRLSRGQGGKAFFTVTGDVGAVKASIEAAKDAISNHGSLVRSAVIPSPHSELMEFLF
jgi:microcompartment protein CcmL/EutN